MFFLRKNLHYWFASRLRSCLLYRGKNQTHVLVQELVNNSVEIFTGHRIWSVISKMKITILVHTPPWWLHLITNFCINKHVHSYRAHATTLSIDIRMYISPGWMSQNHLPHSLKHGYWHKNIWFGPFLGFGHWGTSHRLFNFGLGQL